MKKITNILCLIVGLLLFIGCEGLGNADNDLSEDNTEDQTSDDGQDPNKQNQENNPLEITTIAANPDTLELPSEVDFSITVDGGSGSYSYLWTFENDTTSTEQNPTHDYTNKRACENNEATVAVTDTQDTELTIEKKITLTFSLCKFNTPPSSMSKAHMNVTGDIYNAKGNSDDTVPAVSVIVGKTVSLTVKDIPNDMTCLVKFGDEGPVDLDLDCNMYTNFTNIYQETGQYTISLLAMSTGGGGQIWEQIKIQVIEDFN